MSRLRILLVEDDRGSREALRALLETLGHEVEEAEDGERAISLAFTRRPDLILLDVGLPGLSGHEVAQRIRRERGGDVFVMVACTGHQPSDRAASDGFDGYLLKPVDLEQLAELLAAVSTGSARQTIS